MTSHSPEVEKLARTLKASKIVQTESEAYRMASDMLNTSNKVKEDFKKRDEFYHGAQAKNPEMEQAHSIMEKLTSNLAKGKDNVRIDVDELDLNKPLKELIPEEQFQTEEEEDDAVLINSPDLAESQVVSEIVHEPVVVEEPQHEKTSDEGDDAGSGDDSDEEVQSSAEESSEDEFSVKEL